MIGQPSLFAAGSQRRRLRNPGHIFNVRHAPYEIQPFVIAPVLPGETLQSASFQTRALTAPIKASLIGWWLEHYLFYVKLTDIDHRNGEDLLQQMLINDSAITTHEDYRTAATDPAMYFSPHSTGTYTGMDYVRACLKVVVENFFRDQNSAWDAVTIDGNAAAYLVGNGPFDSAVLETAMDSALDVTIETTEQEGTPNIVQVSTRDVVEALRQYEILYEQGLVDMTWEDYLRSYGVHAPREGSHVPELLRYFRSWQYPSSHVAPDTVTAGESDVTTAISWVVRERVSKRRYFREPGFIFGVTCARPKMYNKVQRAPICSLMVDSKDWLPAVTMGAREAGWRKVTDGDNCILGGAPSGDYWLDLRDLFVYGDQFFAGDELAMDTVTDVNKNGFAAMATFAKAPVQADVDALYVSGDATGGVKQDGVLTLHISSRVRDLSPRGAVPTLVT